MKIMIMKCESRDSWYKSSIGKSFSVLKSDSSRYYVKPKNSSTLVPILKSDCAIIEK